MRTRLAAVYSMATVSLGMEKEYQKILHFFSKVHVGLFVYLAPLLKFVTGASESSFVNQPKIH